MFASPLASGRETHSAIEDQRVESRLRSEGEVVEFWLARPIPIFQSSFQIAFEKINRRNKAIRVVVLRLDI